MLVPVLVPVLTLVFPFLVRSMPVPPAAPVADELLTSRELQAQLKVSSTTLWRAGELPHVKIGARRRYILREVLEHLAAKPRRGAGGTVLKGGRHGNAR